MEYKQNPEKIQDEDQQIRLPAIALDIDGVALRGSLIIGNADQMVRQILAPRTELKKLDNGENIRLPFTFLTNGGGFVEERKAQELNNKLKLSQEDPIYKLTAQNIIQCHTPLREKTLVDRYKDKYVLVCGYDEVLDAALKYGYEKAIHVDELAAVYPNAVPIDIPTLQKDRIELFR